MSVNNFDVMKEMAKRNGNIRLAPLTNITRARYIEKHKGTEITIGFPGNVVAEVLLGNSCGGLIVCGKEEFERVKAELEDLARGVE